MLKKCVSLLLTVCFLMIFCVTAYGDTIYENEFDIPGALLQYCSVQQMTTAWRVDDTKDWRGNYAYYTEETHTYTLRRTYYCQYCLQTVPYPDYRNYTVVESHHLEYSEDGGHVEGTSLHLRNRDCRECGRFSITYTCFGPPCAVYLRLDGLLDVE